MPCAWVSLKPSNFVARGHHRTMKARFQHVVHHIESQTYEIYLTLLKIPHARFMALTCFHQLLWQNLTIMEVQCPIVRLLAKTWAPHAPAVNDRDMAEWSPNELTRFTRTSPARAIYSKCHNETLVVNSVMLDSWPGVLEDLTNAVTPVKWTVSHKV